MAPTWIDLTKPAGKTAQIPPEPRSILTNWLLLRHIFFAPNLVWLLISLTSYVVFPYDLDAAKTWSSDWVLHRVTINLGVMSAYYIFWEASLYGLQWSQRKFCAHLWPTNGKILHNYCFTILGDQMTHWLTD